VSQVSGRDLAAAVRTPRSATPRPAFSHTTVLSPPLERASQAWALAHRAIPRIDPELMWVAARSGDLAFTLQRTNERFTMTVFDVEADAGQTHDLFDPDDPAHRAMRQRLDEYKARLVRGYRAHVGAAAPLPSTEQEERLRKLGYVE
jgi:hypothetical protein